MQSIEYNKENQMKKNEKVLLCKVSAHTGIEENEEADKAAK